MAGKVACPAQWGLHHVNAEGRSHHNGYRWPADGSWATAPDWDPAPVCGGGYHIQTPDHAGAIVGDGDSIPRLVEWRGESVAVGSDKRKVQQLRSVAEGQDALDMLAAWTGGDWAGSLIVGPGMTWMGHTIRGGAGIHPGAQLPELTAIRGNATIRPGAQLPELTAIGGNATIHSGAYVPALATIEGSAYIYPGAQIPALTAIRGGATIHKEAQLPALETIGGDAYIHPSAYVPKLASVAGRPYHRNDGGN